MSGAIRSHQKGLEAGLRDGKNAWVVSFLQYTNILNFGIISDTVTFCYTVQDD